MEPVHRISGETNLHEELDQESSIILEVQNVSKSLGRLQVLDNFSFHALKGEALGILGPNGAGKTTMLNLISGDYPLTNGEIVFNGKPITAMPASERCRLGIGRTYQIPRPFAGLTVYENVLVGALFGNGNRTGDEVTYQLCWDVLQQTGLLGFSDTIAGNLRLLQRKRLELARALATRPKLLLLDEIAGGLTLPEIEELLVIISDIRTQGVTIIWIEHIVHAIASVVERIIAMNFGVKLIEGPPETILASREFQEIYLGVGDATGFAQM
jgi:branched-chain amino acid transport system ATP-binding protein